MEPHFNLWCYFYQLVPGSGVGAQKVVGGCQFVLREDRRNQYINLGLRTQGVLWKSQWFYVQDPYERLPEDVDIAPAPSSCWLDTPMEFEMDQVRDLLGRLAEKDLDGVTVALSFLGMRFQPLKQREHRAWEFFEGCSSRERDGWLTHDELADRARRLFAPGIRLHSRGRSLGYNSHRPRPAVCSCESPLECSCLPLSLLTSAFF